MNISIKKYNSIPIQVRAAFWFMICSFLQKGISMVTTPIFTRIMTTDEYGQFGVFVSWYGIISTIVALALNGGVHTQGLVKYDKDRSVFSSSLQGLTITLIIIWLTIYLLFYRFWNNIFTLTSVQMICMFIIIWVNASFGFWANEQRVKYSYKSLVFFTLTSSIIKPVIEIVLVVNANDKASARIIGWGICDFIILGWSFFWQLLKGKVFYSKRFWSYALAFNIPLIPHYLSQTVLNSADRIMIQKMIGDKQAGIYNLAYSVALIMTLFNSALGQAISPWIYQKIKKRRLEDLEEIAYMTLIMIALLNLILILFAPEIVEFFAPREYYEAIWIIPPVAMSVYFMYSYDLFAKIAFYYEKTSFIMTASIIGAVLNIGLNYYFIGKFGYLAAGYTTLVCYIVYASLHYIYMRKVCRDYCGSIYPYCTGKLLKISFLFIVSGFILLETYKYSYIRYSVAAICCFVAFLHRERVIIVVKRVLNHCGLNP